MSRADSPLRDRMIFCFGGRRSGTHLMERMIAAHPAVSSVPSESHLISHGIAPLLERFHHGVKSSNQVGAMYADRDVLLDALRDLCDTVFAEFLEPAATHVLERTPLTAMHGALIAELYPDAGVVHVIRDGRDAALSLVRRNWGPATIEEAAREWADCVRGGREASALDRYVEVRYEDLLTDPAPVVERMLERIDLDHSAAAVEMTMAPLGVARNVEPGDRIGTGKWREAYSEADRAAFERVAGETLRELGYEEAPVAPAGDTSEQPVPTGASSLRRLARRVRALVRRPSKRPEEQVAQIEEASWSAVMLDRLLTAAREGREEAVLDLLDPSPEAVLVDPDGQLRTETGEEARRLLASVLTADPALRGRQVAGEVLPGRPITAAAVTLELPDGTRAGRVLAIDVRDGLVKRAIVELAESPVPASSRPRD